MNAETISSKNLSEKYSKPQFDDLTSHVSNGAQQVRSSKLLLSDSDDDDWLTLGSRKPEATNGSRFTAAACVNFSCSSDSDDFDLPPTNLKATKPSKISPSNKPDRIKCKHSLLTSYSALKSLEVNGIDANTEDWVDYNSLPLAERVRLRRLREKTVETSKASFSQTITPQNIFQDDTKENSPPPKLLEAQNDYLGGSDADGLLNNMTSLSLRDDVTANFSLGISFNLSHGAPLENTSPKTNESLMTSFSQSLDGSCLDISSEFDVEFSRHSMTVQDF